MSIDKYCITLRNELLSHITGIKNSGFSLFWDNTTPNYVTRGKLERVYEEYLRQAACFGLFLVTRHSNCPHASHTQNKDHDYIISNDYGLNIFYNDPDYIWSGDQMYQGKRTCHCPCSPDQNPIEHWVIEDVIYSKNIDTTNAKKIYPILSDIYAAIEQSGDKQPRSGIRENLLRAVLQLNDLILPVPVEDHIKKVSL
ncbi:MAG: hypothetical protein KJ017_05675 [Alphaproteobacteria bacterium]|nr:hypothetical protein [Alphaproteobacteria bacterium]